MPDLEYPENTVWYVEAGENKQGGSAVAVCLGSQTKDAPAKTYLLTAAHVVRGNSTTGVAGYGDLLSIRVWPPGVNYLKAGNSCSASVMQEIKPLPNDPEYQSDDWVLLRIENQKLRETAATVKRLGQPAVGQQTRKVGYPDGKRSFENHHDSFVKPTTPDERSQVDKVTMGLIEIQGTDSRAGMSGGGVFSHSDERFLGLHRSRSDATLKMHSISAEHIFDWLAKTKQLKLHEGPDLTVNEDQVRDFLELRNWPIEFDWRTTFQEVLPRASTFSANTLGNYTFDGAIRHLALLQDSEGCSYLSHFAYRLSQLNLPNDFEIKLNLWFENHGRPTPLESVVKNIPARIVVEVALPGQADESVDPETDDAAPQPQSQFQFKTWVFGTSKPPLIADQVATVSQFAQIMNYAWSYLEGKDNREVWVEVFVPKQLLNWAIELEEVCEKEASGGREYPARRIGVTHHFALRVMREDGPFAKIRSRFNRLKKDNGSASFQFCCASTFEEVSTGDQRRYAMLVGDEIDYEDLMLDLDPLDEVFGVLWKCPPVLLQGSNWDLWDVVFDCGIPMICWVRQVAEDPPVSYAKAVELINNKPWETLPEEIKKARRESARKKQEGKWHLGKHLAVILDDPTRPHPSDILKQRSPKARGNR